LIIENIQSWVGHLHTPVPADNLESKLIVLSLMNRSPQQLFNQIAQARARFGANGGGSSGGGGNFRGMLSGTAGLVTLGVLAVGINNALFNGEFRF
jgi:hypothetical protein